MPDTFRVGPGPVRLHLKIENTRERRTDPERHRHPARHRRARADRSSCPTTTTRGSTGPPIPPRARRRCSRSAARSAGSPPRAGSRRRTIVIAAWDAEEYTLTGSTEWGEENETDLKRERRRLHQRGRGDPRPDVFAVRLAPALRRDPRGRARRAGSRARRARASRIRWRRERAASSGSRATRRRRAPRDELPVSILGSGSDYTVFFNHLGIASADLVFDGPYGVYHSVYDTYHWMETEGDPGFLYHAAMAQYAGVLALRFANADVLPFDAAAYGREIAGYARELAGAPAANAGRARSSRRWREGRAPGAGRRGRAEVHRRGPCREPRDGRAVARRATRGCSRSSGTPRSGRACPDRPWFRHLIYAPLPSYAAETLPAIRESPDRRARRTRRGREIERLGKKLDAATAAARKLSGPPASPPRPTPRRR